MWGVTRSLRLLHGSRNVSYTVWIKAAGLPSSPFSSGSCRSRRRSPAPLEALARPRARFTGGLHGYLFLVGDWPQRAREVSIELEVAEPTLKTDWELPVAVTDLRRVIRAQHLREEVVERRIA